MSHTYTLSHGTPFASSEESKIRNTEMLKVENNLLKGFSKNLSKANIDVHIVSEHDPEWMLLCIMVYWQWNV